MGLDHLEHLKPEGYMDEKKKVPDLPMEGDPDDFEPEPVPSHDFKDEHAEERGEYLEDPNDLSQIEREFDD